MSLKIQEKDAACPLAACPACKAPRADCHQYRLAFQVGGWVRAG